MVDSSRQTPSFDLRAKLRCDPDSIAFLSSAYALSAALFSAVELGVFDRLENERLSLQQLADQLQLPPRALERLVVLLHALGLVDRDSEGRYGNAAVSTELLTSCGASSVRPFLLHQQRHMYALFGHLTHAIRVSGPQAWRWAFDGECGDDPARADTYDAFARSATEGRLFLEAMNAMAVGVGDVIAKRVDFQGIRTLLDFGGGGGQIDVELARCAPHLEITIVDHPYACDFAEAFVARHGLSTRIRTISADFLAPLPVTLGPVDAVLLGGVLADWDEPRRSAILANARKCLAPGGTLLVSETLLDDSNDGPLLPALLSLVMLVAAHGKNFTPTELERELRRAGFLDVAFYSNRTLGVRDLVTAVR
jgi:3-hydroxy-5-methyl-1-naphthoate 3-O-methyltransferase